MTLIKKINKDNPAFSNFLFILAFTLLGVFLRLLFLQKSDFVINDGGMFYTMILDLQKNNFALPLFTSYNNSQIPFAYPPLSFYTGAAINQFLHIDLVTIFRIYPLFYNILSIPAVYFLAREITRNNRQALLSTGFYSILMPGYEWLISGGGLTRSPAHTLFIIAFTLYLVYIRNKQWKYLVFSIITASLMTLHHIEYCWMLVFSMVLFSIHHLTLKECIRAGLIYLAGGLIFTSPYWISVSMNHGWSPFISAFTAGEFDFFKTFARLVIMVFTEEILIQFINSLAIIGLLYCLFSRKYLIVFWLILIGFLNPRSANRSLIFPVILLASIALDELICPALDRLWKSQNQPSGEITGPDAKRKSNPSLYSQIFMMFCIGFPFFLGFLNTLGVHPVLSMLPKQELESMEWIKNNTATDATFVVLNPSIEWHMDKMGEWFPALTQRKSLTTIQGTEWLPNSTFENDKLIYDDFKKCADIGESCLSEWSAKNEMHFNYLVVSRCVNTADSLDAGLNYFNQTVHNSGKYDVVYENEAVTIFHKK
ncbi:MAG: hypothetical protein GYA15_13380 [Leptolinea sp.]|jgi:hypothetical protein|nr:hypothetical protein [Leptolinea sp.]